MQRFFRLAIIIFLALSGLVVAFFALLYVRNMVKLESVRVGLSWLNQAQFAGIYVADDIGFYKKEGIDVRLIERDLNGQSPISLLKEGKVNVAIVSSGDFLRAADAGEDVVALAAVFQTSPIVIASLEQSHIRSPKDLAGKKVGMAVVTEESKLPVYALLEEVKIAENSVSFSEVGHNQVEALLRKEVDAISIFRTNELYELEKKNIPHSLLFPERFGVDMYGDIIVVSKEYLLSHEKEVGGFLRATFRGWKFAEQNPDEAVRITLQVDNPKYHDVAREDYILKNALKMIRVYPKQTLGQMIPLQWSYMYMQFKNHGLISEIELDNFFIGADIYQKLNFPEY